MSNDPIKERMALIKQRQADSKRIADGDTKDLDKMDVGVLLDAMTHRLPNDDLWLEILARIHKGI